ncbi:MAG: dCMP deaminase family protein [Candidatus Parvarchaeota archaeon]|nr:dCMP deaminase family protein [Candidatus Jingweiarchaeum tengchongense]MCW1298375.1 dCMP deaminase family protein [Candidatus Jingweiarchaeum tengchongense]MCW1300323.1 dCMP deaminase family protein [Candidatus Jingweiarchaeum tengchongense]MCW1304880.1 dCMP deaminase family protein [Candidatus Jingweiarchaeum tengchongense]MCW1305819.1 dCMP deaminase family protein [Candidatus Jingweiarchaeum tengchongense]
MEENRMPLDEYFMRIALLVAKRSTCVKVKRGAVLVKDKHIIATGYNGAPRGLPHCTRETCLRLNVGSMVDYENCRAVHAEMNTIIQAAVHGVSVDGATIYTTTFPCIGCFKALINAGIKRVVYLKEHDAMNNKTLKELIEQSKMQIDKIDLKEE